MRTFSPRRTAKAVLTVLAGLTLAASMTGTPASAHDAPDGHDSASSSKPTLTAGQRHIIREATKQFRDPAVAVAAEYVPSEHCTSHPELGGMGHHYVNYANVMDGVADPAKPDVLVYVPTKDGRLTLGAAEWMGVDPDQDVTTDDGRPFLFGHPFDGPMPGHETGMPVHFDLHVWLYKHNPAGMLAPFNPEVSC